MEKRQGGGAKDCEWEEEEKDKGEKRDDKGAVGQGTVNGEQEKDRERDRDTEAGTETGGQA